MLSISMSRCRIGRKCYLCYLRTQTDQFLSIGSGSLCPKCQKTILIYHHPICLQDLRKTTGLPIFTLSVLADLNAYSLKAGESIQIRIGGPSTKKKTSDLLGSDKPASTGSFLLPPPPPSSRR